MSPLSIKEGIILSIFKKITLLTNKFFWQEVEWKLFYSWRHKRQLFKKFKKQEVYNFDIVNCYEYLFDTFCFWWENSGKRYKELDEFNKGVTEGWVDYSKLKYIYLYIKEIRVHNQKILDLASHESSKYFNFEFIPIEGKKYSKMKINYSKYVKFTFLLDKMQRRINTYVVEEVPKQIPDFYLLDYDDLLIKWDIEVIQLILKYRERLWV